MTFCLEFASFSLGTKIVCMARLGGGGVDIHRVVVYL